MNLLNWAEIDRPFTTSVDGRTADQVEVRLQDTPNGHILFIINHGTENEEVEVTLNNSSSGVYALRDLISDTRSEARSSENGLSIRTQVDGKNVRVIEITK